jgi:hypothetical protein
MTQKEKMTEVRKYVNQNVGIDSSKLSDSDVIKVATLYIKGGAYETPRFARADNERLQLGIDLSMF